MPRRGYSSNRPGRGRRGVGDDAPAPRAPSPDRVTGAKAFSWLVMGAATGIGGYLALRAIKGKMSPPVDATLAEQNPDTPGSRILTAQGQILGHGMAANPGMLYPSPVKKPKAVKKRTVEEIFDLE